jgi:hypothetical protein
MKNTFFEGTEQTPSISINLEKGEFSFAGKSYPENVNSAFAEVLSIIDAYCKKPKKSTTLNFEWLYFNTATSKIQVHIIQLLEKSGTDLVINWICDKNFEVMIEKGNFLKEILDVNINIIKR